MTVPSNDKRLWTRVSPDGKSMAGAIGMKPGGGGAPQPYDGHGQYLGTHAAVSMRTGAVRVAAGTLLADRGRTRTDAGGLSGGNTVRGPVTGPEKEKYPPPPPAPKEPHLTYSQSTGELTDMKDKPVGVGYSGKGEAKNMPEKEGEKNAGPIPQGNYRVAELVNEPNDPRCQKMGPNILRLEPADQQTRDRLAAMNRDGFYIHGGGSDASTGCIIMGPRTRAGIGKGEVIHVRR